MVSKTSLNTNFVYLGYLVSPVELLWAACKSTNINPNMHATGKKVFKNVCQMFQRRLVQVSPATIVMYWHKVTLHWFEYLSFQKLWISCLKKLFNLQNHSNYVYLWVSFILWLRKLHPKLSLKDQVKTIIKNSKRWPVNNYTYEWIRVNR